MASATYLFPGSQALAVFESEERLTIIEPTTGSASTLTGSLVAEARTLFEGEANLPRLNGLADVHVGMKRLLDLIAEPKLLSSPTEALKLEGFGTLFLELVGQCNERCSHCYAGSGPEINQALPQAKCEEIISDAGALGFSRVQFTGGDPLLCRFLPDLVRHAKEVGIGCREVYTNGLALSDNLLDELEPSGPAFAISFYSSDPEVHDGITNTPGSCRRTSEAIKRTLDRGLGLRVGVIAMEENAAGVEATLAYLKELGVESVAVSPTFEVGRGTHFDTPSPVFVGNSHGGPAAAGKARAEGKLCVTYEGDVVPCIFNREMKLGSIYEQSLSEIAASPGRVGRKVVTRDQFLESCRSGLQCSSCKLTACALHFDRR
jgi:MoaA/NifB/PqqE/SkfB family radical SAM enzyme